MTNKTIHILKGVIFLIISLYLAFTFTTSLTNFVGKVPIVGWVSGSVILRLVISLAFARGVQLIYKAVTSSDKSILVFLIGTLVGFTIVFIAQPIYTTDYGNFGTTDLSIDIEELKNETYPELELNSNHALIVFFSTNCGSCKEMSTKIGQLQSIGRLPNVIALFPGNESDAIQFMTENNGNGFNHYMINNDEYFQQTADFSFPSIFLVDKTGKTIQHWDGSLMNYTAFDIIESYN